MASRAKGLALLDHRSTISDTGCEESHVHRRFVDQSCTNAALKPDEVSGTRDWHLEEGAHSSIFGNLLAAGTADTEEQSHHTQILVQLG